VAEKLVALLAIALRAWWFFSRNGNDVGAAGADSTGVAAAYNAGGVPAAADRGSVDSFLVWVANNDMTSAAAT